MRTHYENLQVSRNARPKVITAAYMTLTQEWHPDNHPGNVDEAERVMRILNKAFDVLSDPKRREEHDRWIDSQSSSGASEKSKKENPVADYSSQSKYAHWKSSPVGVVSKFPTAWKRLGAGLIDFFLLIILGFLSGVFFSQTIASTADTQEDVGNMIKGLGFLISWMYFSMCETSKYQATPGKYLLGIKVTDINGERIGFGRASGRYWGKLISGFIFGLGYIMIIFTKNKQGLHDAMAECLVVNKPTN